MKANMERLLAVSNQLRLARLALMTLQVEAEQRKEQAIPYFLKGAIKDLEQCLAEIRAAETQFVANYELERSLQTKVRGLNGNN